MTNPPYSGEHKVKLLNFLASRPAQPYALLLPAYTATKSYWREFATSAATATTPGNNSSKGTFNSLTSPFYVLPPDYYEYCHPEGTGKDIPPFYSAWFVGAGTVETRRRYCIESEILVNCTNASNPTHTVQSPPYYRHHGVPSPALSEAAAVEGRHSTHRC